MPNWVTNVLTVEGNECIISEFREFVKGGEWEVEGDKPLSFFKIYPYPGGEMTHE